MVTTRDGNGFPETGKFQISRKAQENNQHILKGNYYNAGPRIHSHMSLLGRIVMVSYGTGNKR
jgi:hypothetical protein